MSIDIQQIINDPLAVRSLSLITQGIPPHFGYPLCERIADWIATRQTPLTQAIRVNQWMARGANLEKAALDQAVQETLRNNARDIYNLYHYLRKPDAMQKMISFSDAAREVLSDLNSQIADC